MQTSFFEDYIDLSQKKVLIGLSGGINSMALLCHIANYPEEYKPKELHLFYAHFIEHSPDTEQFVLDGVKYAKTKFNTVFYTQTHNSILKFFEENKMIPHPMVSPCTRVLKIEPIMTYMALNKIDIDLVGYVRGEVRRMKNMHAKNEKTVLTKGFPIISKDDQWCFDIVKAEIGWYPKIYTIKRRGKRVFHHNNCLPCKNMNIKDFNLVKKHYPTYWEEAMNVANNLQAYWGRSESDYKQLEQVSFGRKESLTKDCHICTFD